MVFGLAIANLLIRAFGNHVCGQHGFRVAAWVLLVSLLVGLLAPPLAALPSIRRAVRLPLRDALHAAGSAVGSQDAGDRLLRRIRFLPRTAQIGLRNVGRRRRRSLATAFAIAFAVGSLIAVLCLAAGIAQTSRTSWGDHGEDVRISSEGRHPLDAQAARLISTTPGVARIEPTFVTDVKLAGKDAASGRSARQRCSTTGSAPGDGSHPLRSGRGHAWPSSKQTSPAPPEHSSAT